MDTQAPSSTSVSTPYSASTQIIELSLSAYDSSGVSGYYLSSSSFSPSLSSTGWVAVPPTTIYSATVSYTLAASTGSQSIYAWFRDEAGNISYSYYDSAYLESGFGSAAGYSCTFGGKTVENFSSVTAYQSDTVAFGEQCVSETRSCNNGSLSGTYSYSSCSVSSAASCSFNGQVIGHGLSVTAYQSSSVPYGGSCSSENRICTNGTLTGFYDEPNCSVESISPCILNGQTIGSGSSVAAYQASSVPFGGSCSSETRLCTNGTFSGSYEYSICGVESGGNSSNIDYSASGELFSSWKSFPVDDYSFLNYRVNCRVNLDDSHHMEIQMKNNSSNLPMYACAGVNSSSTYFYATCGATAYSVAPSQLVTIGVLFEEYAVDGVTGLQQCNNYSARFKVVDPANNNNSIISTFDITSFSDPVDRLD